MPERDDRILNHIGLYRVSLRAVIEHLYFDGASCDHVIERLLDTNRIQRFEGLPGGLSYYQLTLTEARRREIPDHRTRSHDASALREAIGVLWFCCMTDKSRRRIERNQLAHLFGRGKGFGKPHYAEKAGQQSAIYRVYFPGPNSRNDYLIQVLRGDSEEALAHPALAPWVAAKTFGFTVLLETEGRRRAVQRLLNRDDDPLPLPINLELVPDLGTLSEKIRLFQQR